MLKRPGAGLPWFEILPARLFFAGYRRFMPLSAVNARFKHEGETILRLAQTVDSETGCRPVLVRRVFGIEDSSRQWSVYMLLHHLVIVDQGMMAVIESLCAGRPFEQQIKIEQVKPDPATGPEIVDSYRQTQADYQATLTRLSPLKSAQTHDHPWFGPMNARAWHGLAAIHHTIHRRQLQAILSQLALNSPS